MRKTFRARALGWTLALALAGLAPAQAVEESRDGWPEPDPTPIDLLSLEAPSLAGAQAERYRKLQDLPETAEHRAATFQQEGLAAARVLRLRLFDGKEAVFVRDEAQRQQETLTWRGHAEGGSGTAVLVANGDELSGSVSLGQEGSPQILAIDALGGGAVIVRRLALEPLHALKCEAPSTRMPEIPGEKLAGPCTTNVLAVYTPGAQRAHGNIPLLAQLAVAKANQAHAEDKADPLRLNLIGTRQVDYTESHEQTGDVPTDLVRLQDPRDGFLDEVHSWREKLGADVVVLITENLPAGLGGSAAALAADDDTAFAVVLWNAAVNDFFAHEVGHLQGVGHNPEENDPAAFTQSACKVAQLKTTFTGWQFLWGSNTHLIAGWWFDSWDHFVAGDFDGDGADELLAANYGNGFSHLMDYNGASWSTKWNNYGNGWIGSWMLSAGDQIIAGNFVAGNNQDELLIVNHNSRHAHLLRYATGSNSWQTVWSNGGNGWIGSWMLGSADRFLASAFDAASNDELLAISPLSKYSHLQRFNGSSWTHLWGNSGNGWIASWWIGPADRYVAGNFSPWNSGSDLYPANPNGWSNRSHFQSSNWYNGWSNNGSGWIEGWYIGQQDVYLRGNFLPNNSTNLWRDEILIIAPNNGWSAIQFSGQNWPYGWHTAWSNNGSGNIGWWFIGYGNRCIVGDFASGDSRDELLCMQPSNGWAQMHNYFP